VDIDVVNKDTTFQELDAILDSSDLPAEQRARGQSLLTGLRGRLESSLQKLESELPNSRVALSRYAARLELLRRIDKIILAAPSAAQMAEETLPAVQTLLNCQSISLMTRGLDGSITVLAVDGREWTVDDESFADSLWPINRLEQGEVISASVPEPDEPLWQFLQLPPTVRTSVSVPLVAAGQLVGVMNLGLWESEPLSAEQEEIACEVADQIAVGIQQIRLQEQIAEHVRDLRHIVARRTARLRASEERFRAIFENAPLGVALVSREGRVVECNRRLLELLQWDEEEVQDRPVSDFVYTDAESAGLDIQAAATWTGSVQQQFEKQLIRADGQLVWVNLVISPALYLGDYSQYAILMFNDISDQRQAQEALLRAEKMAITGRLAASLAHEINNPLQSVIGFLALARETMVKEDDAHSYLEIALDELRRAARIVGELNDINRPSTPDELELHDINSLVEQVLSLSCAQCEDGDVEVVWEPADDLEPVPMVPDRMQQVFLNLVLNAVDAMPQGGTLRVQSRPTTAPVGVQVSFSDSGQGITAEDQHHVFEPFFSTRSDGLGLGLYISSKIVEDHAGRISMQSRLGVGTTVQVWLPADHSERWEEKKQE
jgi:PAS domain S-box-containing protein